MGNRLREWREERSLSQRELATLAGVSYATIADLERGAQDSMHPKTRRKLAEALGLHPRELLAGKEDRP